MKSKLGDIADRLSILELREFMEPRFLGHAVKEAGGVPEVETLRSQLKENKELLLGRATDIATLGKLNARIWMLQHVEAEIAKTYGLKPEALAALGMIHRLVSAANSTRAEIVAKLNGEPVRKIY